jgi:transcriptional regulator
VLVHPWDAPLTDDEWATWLAAGHDFGQLIVPGRDRDLPVVVPLHFVFVPPATVLTHLARPNPALSALEERPRALLAVVGEWSYIPAAWKAIGEEDPALGIPTSYYAAVQLAADVDIVDEPSALIDLLRLQLGHFEPSSGAADPAVHERLLRGIRGLRLTVTGVQAKFKVGGNVDAAHRQAVAERLAERVGPGDLGARDTLLRRLAAQPPAAESPAAEPTAAESPAAEPPAAP